MSIAGSARRPGGPCAVPSFDPVLPPRGRHRLRRAVRRRRRAVAASLAVAAAALAAAAPRDSGRPAGPLVAEAADPPEDGRATAAGSRPAARPGSAVPDRPERSAPDGGALVAAPVRIADPGAARLLSPGDLVDVLATGPAPPGAGPPRTARLVAHRAEVAAVPPGVETDAPGDAARGALVVLAVPPETAARLAAAAADSELAVTRW
ncbi:RcpC/CpaB family pilus assembly protein [Streptomyces aidingensis]|uniref:Flp pilus assembly protein RcpC/CpaB n=1 Tax=Streptomyces aidingensis TaxID=910347 RepID=A0A1I1H0Z2_9ACTN|nr:RcpC/CpaB family pilus assembly protein [Streptomyces aidingensis]SFC17819.1 Flp pilus assembly protein RcpC/CpaB [Streptomyces aidingensis]